MWLIRLKDLKDSIKTHVIYMRIFNQEFITNLIYLLLTGDCLFLHIGIFFSRTYFVRYRSGTRKLKSTVCWCTEFSYRHPEGNMNDRRGPRFLLHLFWEQYSLILNNLGKSLLEIGVLICNIHAFNWYRDVVAISPALYPRGLGVTFVYSRVRIVVSCVSGC